MSYGIAIGIRSVNCYQGHVRVVSVDGKSLNRERERNVYPKEKKF